MCVCRGGVEPEGTGQFQSQTNIASQTVTNKIKKIRADDSYSLLELH